MRSIVNIYKLGRKREWRWRLLDARNRRIIGTSNESYKNRHYAVTNLKRVTGCFYVPEIPYGTKSIEWLVERTGLGGIEFVGNVNYRTKH